MKKYASFKVDIYYPHDGYGAAVKLKVSGRIKGKKRTRTTYSHPNWPEIIGCLGGAMGLAPDNKDFPE